MIGLVATLLFIGVHIFFICFSIGSFFPSSYKRGGGDNPATLFKKETATPNMSSKTTKNDKDCPKNRDCGESDESDGDFDYSEEEEIPEEEDNDYSPSEDEEEEEEGGKEEETLVLPTKATTTKRKRGESEESLPPKKRKRVESATKNVIVTKPSKPTPTVEEKDILPPPAKKARTKKSTIQVTRKVDVRKKKPAKSVPPPPTIEVEGVVEDEEEEKKKKDKEDKEKKAKEVLPRKTSFKVRDVSRPTTNFTRDKFLLGERYAVQIEDVAIFGKSGTCFSSTCIQFIRDPPEPNENNAKVFKMGIPIKFIFALQETINSIVDSRSGKQQGGGLE